MCIKSENEIFKNEDELTDYHNQSYLSIRKINKSNLHAF